MGPLNVGIMALAIGASFVQSVPCTLRNPFKVLDAQNWVNPDDMTWADFKAPPGTSWSDPAQKGWSRNFNIALVTVDYDDEEFVITRTPGSTVFGNPQSNAPSVTRDGVPSFYRDLLNTPNELNGGHTLHEYWMGDSFGKFGVDLTAFGPYRLPSKSFQYGIDSSTDGFNPNACPDGYTCGVDLRTDALGAWRQEVGNETASSYELVFILSAGQDESSTWQEFGEMKFNGKEDVPDSFGAPVGVSGNNTLPNYAKTRYVEWTSWVSAATIWPNAGGGSSTQGESSGMATYAHELSHLLGIGDNYNNPYGVPLRRAYTGPFSMLDRGSFNGPGGPHKRWMIPATEGGTMGSLHTMRDKFQIGLIGNDSMLQLARDQLPISGLVVAELTARAVDHGETGLMGLRVQMGTDLAPPCNTSTDVLCDGGGYNNYDIEVIDRMGADSFTPDHGVMISKTKTIDNQPFQWVIDANPQNIDLVDFIRPNGSVAMITLGDYRQLADALFHAGTRSGSEFEYADEDNRLHFYAIDIHRDTEGVLSYTVGVRSLDGTGGASAHGVVLGPGTPDAGKPTGNGTACWFQLNNTGAYVDSGAAHPDDATPYLQSDVYRLSAEVDGEGWTVELQNALAAVTFGAGKQVYVAVAAEADAAANAIVTLTATSESDGSVSSSAECSVPKSRGALASIDLK